MSELKEYKALFHKPLTLKEELLLLRQLQQEEKREAERNEAATWEKRQAIWRKQQQKIQREKTESETTLNDLNVHEGVNDTEEDQPLKEEKFTVKNASDVKQLLQIITMPSIVFSTDTEPLIEAEIRKGNQLFELLNNIYHQTASFSLPALSDHDNKSIFLLLKYRIRNLLLTEAITNWIRAEEKPEEKRNYLTSSGEEMLSGILPYTNNEPGLRLFQADMITLMVDMFSATEKNFFPQFYNKLTEIYKTELQNTSFGKEHKITTEFSILLQEKPEYSFLTALKDAQKHSEIQGFTFSYDPHNPLAIKITVTDVPLDHVEPKAQMITRYAKARFDQYKVTVHHDLKGLEKVLQNFYGVIEEETQKKQATYTNILLIDVPAPSMPVQALVTFFEKARLKLKEQNPDFDKFSFAASADGSKLELHLKGISHENLMSNGQFLKAVIQQKQQDKAQQRVVQI